VTKDIFENFPSAEYLPEIEGWREIGEDKVAFTVRRRATPLGEEK